MISRREVVLALAAAGCTRSPDATLPRFQHFAAYLPRETANGTAFEPVALEGKVVLVTFVATWCFPCLADLVTLSHLERDFGPKGFANVIVGMDLEGRRVLEPFAAGYKISSPVVVADDRLRSGETPFGRIRELPSRVLFGRDGRVVLGYSGVTKYEDLERIVASEVSKN